MKAKDLRQRYIDFFVKKHGHKEILGASLIPENDPTVLFTTAGMHPLVPYLMGETHPEGKRLVDVQKCLRTDDIDEVGDNTHCTFFEMLGNWSLGDYFKREAIEMSYEFLTTPVEDGGLGLDPARLAVTCFEGDEDAARDEESAAVWRELGFPDKRIFFYGKKENWWGPAGQTGPCGPCTEMFYFNSDDLGAMYDTEPADNDTPWVEIWNDVFMEFNKREDGSFEPLHQKNVDTGMGLERVTAIMQGKATHFETELFEPVMVKIRELASQEGEESERIVADHLRAAVFIIGDEMCVTPSNCDQGYVLRRLIRRAIRHGRKLGIRGNFTDKLARIFVDIYGDYYSGLSKSEARILEMLKNEEEQFGRALTNGEAEIQKDIARAAEALDVLANESQVARLEMALNAVSQIMQNQDALQIFNGSLRPVLGRLRSEFKAEAAGKDVSEDALLDIRKKAEELKEHRFTVRGDRAFYYFETHGFPLEMTQEILEESGFKVDSEGFDKAFLEHQKKSRAGAEQKFSGGLADNSDEVRKLHTATHLMLEALKRVLGRHVEQKGSNITAERLRFDFNYDSPLTPEQIAEVEKIVNDAIKADYPVSFTEMTVLEAREKKATGVFADKYEGELSGKVKVYSIDDFSKEICGGPHATHTGELGSFKIVKEQSSSAGVRRIKGVLR